jgi:hypothetical protein
MNCLVFCRGCCSRRGEDYLGSYRLSAQPASAKPQRMSRCLIHSDHSACVKEGLQSAVLHQRCHMDCNKRACGKGSSMVTFEAMVQPHSLHHGDCLLLAVTGDAPATGTATTSEASLVGSGLEAKLSNSATCAWQGKAHKSCSGPGRIASQPQSPCHYSFEQQTHVCTCAHLDGIASCLSCTLGRRVRCHGAM